MYDTRQEPNEFVAESLASAKAKAAEFFSTDEGSLVVAQAPDGEIFGAGGQVVIVAAPQEVVARGPRRNEGDSRGGDRGGRGERGPRREGRGDRGDDRGGRPRGRDRDRDRGGRGRDRERGNDRGERGGRNGGRGEERERMGGDEVRKAVSDSKGVAKGDLGPIGDFLLGAVERMKLGSFEISESSEGDFLIYQLSGAAAEALQAGDGRATDALQLVANQVSMRQSDEAPRIVVDVEGGGDEREDTLGRLSDRAAKRARETGRAIALDPMNSRDRRTIHLTIRDMDGVATMSIGEGRYRQVLVVPEGAPEYDDAVAESSR